MIWLRSLHIIPNSSLLSLLKSQRVWRVSFAIIEITFLFLFFYKIYILLGAKLRLLLVKGVFLIRALVASTFIFLSIVIRLACVIKFLHLFIINIVVDHINVILFESTLTLTPIFTNRVVFFSEIIKLWSLFLHMIKAFTLVVCNHAVNCYFLRVLSLLIVSYNVRAFLKILDITNSLCYNIQTTTFILHIMTTPLSISHSHAHAFFTVILLITFAKCTSG